MPDDDLVAATSLLAGPLDGLGAADRVAGSRRVDGVSRGEHEWLVGHRASCRRHAVLSEASPDLLGVVTWQERVPVQLAARRTYCVEAYALVSETLWRTCSRAARRGSTSRSCST